MKKELKQAIIKYIFDHIYSFQLHNNSVEEFRYYIYDKDGEYLIGGLDVRDFLTKAIELIRHDYNK